MTPATINFLNIQDTLFKKYNSSALQKLERGFQYIEYCLSFSRLKSMSTKYGTWQFNNESGVSNEICRKQSFN